MQNLDDLLEANRPHLCAQARRLARDEAEAEDLVQETMLRAFVHRDAFAPGTNARAWLGRILRNLFIDRRRHAAANRRLEVVLANEPMTGIGPDPAHALDAARVRARVCAALAALPEAFRRAVELVDLEDADYATAALAMACPEGTVMSRVHRGRRRLAFALGAEGAAMVA